MEVLERRAAITGVGMSRVGRRLCLEGLALAVDAALAAVEDAGLTVRDIDGLSTWPGFYVGTVGHSPVGIWELKEALGLQLNWFMGGAEGPGHLAAVINAAMAVATGQARHVLCFRATTESSAQTAGRRASVQDAANGRVTGQFEWQTPFDAVSSANWTGLLATAYANRFGLTREQLGQVALTERRNACLNPNAVFRTPLSMEEYLAARIISTPFCLLDCDVPLDGAVAVIVSRFDETRSMRRPPLRIEAASGALHGRFSWYQTEDLTTMAAHDAARVMWSRTDLKPADVNVAGLYDGFSMFVLFWLEALGFCAHGEASRFVEGGSRIARDGEIPINTGGGQLSGGRLHGFGLLHEVCVQLWGEAGARQVAGSPQIGVVGTGGGPIGASLLLSRY